jgi:CO/xanthine dehydrogenase Mo-binding subunit
MKWDAVNLPDLYNPIGAKGVGEPPVAAGATAVVNAIVDALGGEKFFNRTPITSDMILNALEALPQSYKAFAAYV